MMQPNKVKLVVLMRGSRRAVGSISLVLSVLISGDGRLATRLHLQRAYRLLPKQAGESVSRSSSHMRLALRRR